MYASRLCGFVSQQHSKAQVTYWLFSTCNFGNICKDNSVKIGFNIIKKDISFVAREMSIEINWSDKGYNNNYCCVVVNLIYVISLL